MCPVASCDLPPASIVLSGPVHVPVPIASTMFDPRSVIGLRWRVPSTCGIAVTIDDVTFVNP
jgi:hypothetical protein